MWFVGDDWAEDHHDVEVQDGAGRRLARARLPEGVAGIARLHELIAGVVAEEAEPGQVSIGIETDRGRGWPRWSRPATECSQSTPARWPATASGTARPAPRATPPTPTP